jgi:hypothetical protein
MDQAHRNLYAALIILFHCDLQLEALCFRDRFIVRIYQFHHLAGYSIYLYFYDQLLVINFNSLNI